MKPLTKKDIILISKCNELPRDVLKTLKVIPRQRVLGAKQWLKKGRMHSIPKSLIKDCGEYIELKGNYVSFERIDEAFDIEEEQT